MSRELKHTARTKRYVRRSSTRINFGRLAWLILLATVVLGAGLGAGLLAGTLKGMNEMPVLSNIEPRPRLTSIIYDVNGQVFDSLHSEENRILTKLDDVPLDLQHAFIAVEDTTFYEHIGVNLKAIIRAFYVNVTGKGYQGGSTITQQLVKNAFLTPERTLKRKIQEAVLAIQMERRYTKEQILEMYLNQIPFGNGAYGVQVASKLYFGKDVSDLNLAECALLAGVAQLPTYYDPYTHFDAAKQRQEVVLKQMEKYGYITSDHYQQAANAKIDLKPLKPSSKLGAHFRDYVLQYLLDKYGSEKVYNGGLEIFTTIDPKVQSAAENAVKAILDPVYPLTPDKVQPEVAVVSIEPKTGYIKAIVGGRKHENVLGLNRAIRPRQPGSAFKPLVAYVPAIDLGFLPGSVIDDAPVTYPDGYSPTNYGRNFLGIMTFRESLERSINVAAVKILDTVGVKKGLEYADSMGMSTLVLKPTNGYSDVNRPSALGGLTYGVTPLDMASAYSVLANQGIRMQPVAVLKVVDQHGNVLEEHSPQPKAVISSNTAYLITDMLKGVITRPWGTGTRANIGRPAAGKTGTTSDYADAWFVGFTPELSTAVWMGYDKDKTMESGRVTGGSYPASIWKTAMSEALKDVPAKDFSAPKGYTRQTICKKSGLRPGPWCPAEDLVDDIFPSDRIPEKSCDVHQPAAVCEENPDKLASPYCPSVMEKSFIVRKEPYDASKGIPADAVQQVPTETCSLHGPYDLPRHSPDKFLDEFLNEFELYDGSLEDIPDTPLRSRRNRSYDNENE